MFKQAGAGYLPPAVTRFWSSNLKSLKTKLQAIRRPGYFRDLICENRPEIAGALAGTVGGAYLGSQAFNNSLPPVRALPEIQQSPYIELQQSQYSR